MARSETSPLRQIATLGDGELATVSGKVWRSRPGLLSAPLSGQPCVYWEVNRAVGDLAPERFEASDFWLDDGTGRLLVRGQKLRVEARGERRAQAISMVDADIREVSLRLRELKDARRQAGGQKASQIGAELKRLKKLATLLCAIGAHARGNIHVGGDLAGQEKYIAERSQQFDDGAAQKSLGLMSERYEVALAEGQLVEVSGFCSVAPIPVDVIHGGGYRDLPTCLQLAAPAGGELLVRGVGSAAPRSVPVGEKADSSHPESKARRSPQPAKESRLSDYAIRAVPWLVAAAGALYWLLR